MIMMIKSVEYKDYLFKLIVTLTVFVGLLGFLAETTYREFFKSTIKLAQSEEYSYIIVSFLTTTITLYLALKRIELSHSLRLSKVMFTVILLLLSIITYSLAQLDLEFKVQLMGFSFISISTALLLLICEPSRVCEVVVFLTPLLLIPLPPRFIDSLTLILSKYIGKLVGVVSGVRVIETSNFTQLEVISASSESVILGVEVACTGIIVVSSILVIIPLLAYIVAFSVDKPVRKILILLFSLFTALLIGFLGNFIRVLMLVYAVMKLGVEYAHIFLHYSPSVLYAIVSTLIVLYTARKYLKFKEHSSRNLLEDLLLKITWERVAGVLLLAVIIVGSVSLVLHAISSEVGISHITINTPSISDYLENPVKYLSTSKIVFTSSEYDLFLTRILGGLTVYRVLVRTPEGEYTGYIELTDTPARLHTWCFYLTTQGYLVKALWSSNVEGFRVNFIDIEHNNQSSVLVYTVIPVLVRTESEEFNLYTRISILSSERNESTSELGSVLLSIILEHLSGQARRDISGLLNTLSQSLIYILCVFLLYSVIVLIYKYKVRGVFLSGE